jgi:hypothetical protein
MIYLAKNMIDGCWDGFLLTKPFSMILVKFTVNFVGSFKLKFNFLHKYFSVLFLFLIMGKKKFRILSVILDGVSHMHFKF